VRYPCDWRVSAAMWRNEEVWTRTVGRFATMLLMRLHTFLQPQCWVRSLSPIQRGGDERASERGRACALATPVKSRLLVRKTERSAQPSPEMRNRNYPAAGPGACTAIASFTPSRHRNVSGAGRVATVCGNASRRDGVQRIASRLAGSRASGRQHTRERICATRRSGPRRNKVDSRNASLPCVGLIGWNR
jgi:hypothetical protein